MILTAENYYSPEADKEYMSVSQYKRWIACPAAAKAQYVDDIWKPEKSEAMMLGNYFHGLFDGTAEKFLMETPELLTKKGEKTAGVKQLDELFKRVLQDSFFMNSVTGNDVQQEVIFTTVLFGIKWKCRVDVLDYSRNFFTDIKTVKDFSLVWDENSRKKLEFWQASKYDLQLAVYQKIIELSAGYKLEPYIAAVTKEKVTDYEVFEFTSEDMDTHFAMLLNEVKNTIPAIMEVKEHQAEPWRCEHCDYCKSTKKLTKTKIAEVK